MKASATPATSRKAVTGVRKSQKPWRGRLLRACSASTYHHRLRLGSYRLDGFATGYSLASCSPAELAAALPAGFYVPSARRNCKPPLGEGWGIFDRNFGEFST